METGVVAGVVAIGIVHGVLPDHGWPIAAAYALNRRRKWIAGVVAGLVLGVGHLVSSVALALAYLWFSQFTAVTDGPWMRYVAGSLLVLLGVREYYHGRREQREHHHGRGEQREHHGGRERREHHHGRGETDGADHRSHDHSHAAAESADDLAIEKAAGGEPRGDGVPREGEVPRENGEPREESDERGLAALGTTALLLGFAHEEPIQILAVCAGTPFCLELMLVYSLAVVVAILVPTLLLIAGYQRHREAVEAYAPHLPLVTAVVLVGMGLALITGVL